MKFMNRVSMTKIKGNYGYIGDLHYQAHLISQCLNPANAEHATKLLLETAAAETKLGKVNDRTVYAGMGLCQFDKRPFYNVRARAQKYRKKILECFGIDIDLVEWEHLRYNPFLSLLFCRLYYLLIPKPIPVTLKGRAKYWKKYYNSYLGKGTTKHYVLMSKAVIAT